MNAPPAPAPVLYLLDVDGTLMLSNGAGREALNQAFLALHGHAGAMDGVALAGMTDPIIVEEMFLGKLGRAPSDGERTALVDAYLPILATLLQEPGRAYLMPAVLASLDFLQGCPEVRLAVATGNVRAGARSKLESVRLWHRFLTGGFGDDAADRAVLVARAIARAEALCGFGFARSRVVVVGDTPRDVSAARACGIRALAVATGTYSHAELLETDADAVLHTLAELPAWHRAQFHAHEPFAR